MSSSPPRRRSRAETKAQNRQALLAAAREAMVRDGFRNTLLDDVAEQAGLTKGAIYSIFGGKDELMRALVQEVAEDLAWPELEKVTDESYTLEEQADRYALMWAQSAVFSAPTWEHAFHAELTATILRDSELFETNAATMGAQRDALAAAFQGRRTDAGTVVGPREAEAFASAFAALMQGLTSRVVLHPIEFSERLFRDAARALCGMTSTD